jgi:hypothetical protein
VHGRRILSRDVRYAGAVIDAPHIDPPDPQMILDTVAARYGQPIFCFFFGSHAFGRGDAGSDIDVIVVMSRVENAYRETFSSNGFLFDAQVHDPETLHYVMRLEQRSGVSILAGEVDQARVLPENCDPATALKEVARGILVSGPPPPPNWDAPRRYLSALLSDLERSADADERWMMAVELYTRILELFLRHHGQFLMGPGRHFVQSVKTVDALFFDRAQTALLGLSRDGSLSPLIGVAREVLDLIGGPLTAGFRMDYPEKFRLPLP